MRYSIFKDGNFINRIVADEEFCKKFYSANGYTYECESGPDPTSKTAPEPTEAERLRADIDYIAVMTGVQL